MGQSESVVLNVVSSNACISGCERLFSSILLLNKGDWQPLPEPPWQHRQHTLQLGGAASDAAASSASTSSQMASTWSTSPARNQQQASTESVSTRKVAARLAAHITHSICGPHSTPARLLWNSGSSRKRCGGRGGGKGRQHTQQQGAGSHSAASKQLS